MTKENLKNILTSVRDMINRSRIAYKDYLGDGKYEIKQLDDALIPNTIQRVEGDVIIPSSTADSTKKFKITVDDSGTISATEVT